MTREELLRSEGYWMASIQIDLYNRLETYMKEHNLNRTQLAEKLGVTKGYISQLLNGDFDHKLSKLVELSLAIGLVPTISYTPTDEIIKQDEQINQVTASEIKLVHA